MAEVGGYPVPNGGSDQQSSGRRLSPASGSRGFNVAIPGSARGSTAPNTGRSSNRGLHRSPSPRAGRIETNKLDHRSIIDLSQQCTEELTVKIREKNAMVDLLAELKKKKMQYDGRGGKKKREVDTTIVQTMEMEKKLQQLSNGNKMMTSELTGLRKENEGIEAEVEDLRRSYKEATRNFQRECSEVDEVKRLLNSYRKEIATEAKLRDNVQQDLRASRTAQGLMINRLDDMEKRNRALKTCVANTFNS